MNLLLLDALANHDVTIEELATEDRQAASAHYMLNDPRRLLHIQQHLKLSAGDRLKVGQKNGLKGSALVESISSQQLVLSDLRLDQPPPAKLPLILIVAMPRPKVLRRLVMDAVTLGVEQLILLHSYRVEKSYWQTPFLQHIDDYITLGLEQAGDTVWPSVQYFKRFRPFVEDTLPALIAERQALVAHPYATQPLPFSLNQPTVLLIGPEGGFIPFEIDLLQQNGMQAGSLGGRILRTETAVSSIIGRLFTL